MSSRNEKSAPAGNDKQRREKRLRQLHETLLKSLRKGIRGIDRVEKITHGNVHRIHERMKAIQGQIQELMSELGPEGVIDFRGVDLQHANLVGVSFFRTNLEGADLSGAFGGYFAHANLRSANLRGARIGNASYADLTGADLREAQLPDACLLGARLDRAALAGADLCGATLINIHAEDADWDGAAFDAKTRFSPDFEIPAGLAWSGPGADPRKTALSKSARTSQRQGEEAELSLQCLLTDKQLARLCADLEHDPALPESIAAEDLRHPIYGPDLVYSLALEYCPNRFRGLGLTREEFDFNVWYRAERIARLYDAAEYYCDGNHDRAERLMPALTGDLLHKAYRRIQREIRRVLDARGASD